jgi:hypothetical protein
MQRDGHLQKVSVPFALFFLLLKFLDILRVKNGDLFGAKHGLNILIQLNPVKTAMCGVWINFENHAFVPTFFIAKFRIKINFYAVTDLYCFGHDYFLSIKFCNASMARVESLTGTKIWS